LYDVPLNKNTDFEIVNGVIGLGLATTATSFENWAIILGPMVDQSSFPGYY